MNNRPMLNAYPDSIGQNLGDMVEFLSRPAVKDVFASYYNKFGQESRAASPAFPPSRA